jgi:hypothetical protein
MKSWRQQVLGWLVMVLGVAGALPVQAEDLLPQPGTWALGVRSGYSIGLSKHAEMVPVNLRIGYTLFKGQKWVIPPGAFEIAVEPFGSAITSIRPQHSGSMELGLGLPVLTYYFNLGNHLAPYVEGGLGLLYTDLRGYHLGGRFSFMETLGAGVAYSLSDNLVLNAGWRYRHISNAGLYKDNVGLNSGIFLAGFSYLLPAR